MSSQTRSLLIWVAAAAAAAALSVLVSPASGNSASAVFKLIRNACLPDSAAHAKFPGQPTRLSCIVECAKAKQDFNAVQMLPGVPTGWFDCECVRLSTNSTPCCRTNCERWDVQSFSGRSSDGTSSSGSDWNATTCPAVGDPWKPVVHVNKCIYRKNDANINLTVASAAPCSIGGQLFDVRDSDTEAQLVKYVNYLSVIGNPISEFWAHDSRTGPNTCAFRIANNGLVKMSPCDADAPSGMTRQLYPICENILCFSGASPSDFDILKIGSSGLRWYYFNSSQVMYNDACWGNQKASIESGDTFEHIKNGILKRGWLGQPVWIANTGGFLPGGMSGASNCLALTINSTTFNVNMTVSIRECGMNFRQVCQYEFNNGDSSVISQVTGIVTNFCPLSTQPPANAKMVRTVGNLCYYHTGANFSLAATSDPNIACESSDNLFIPALVDGDFIKARNYVSNIGGSVLPGWEAWLWTSTPGNSLTSTNGVPITISVSGSGSYYLNRTGSPFKGNSNVSRPVICRSSAEVCQSSLGYLNYASSTNSCVALLTDSASRAASAANCTGQGGGSLVQLQSVEKFNQIRDIVVVSGRMNQLFWVYNGTAANSTNSCLALSVASPMADWASSLTSKSCTDSFNFICEKLFNG